MKAIIFLHVMTMLNFCSFLLNAVTYIHDKSAGWVLGLTIAGVVWSLLFMYLSIDSYATDRCNSNVLEVKPPEASTNLDTAT